MEVVGALNLALNSIVEQLAGLLPKLIIALLIWYAGKYLLSLALGLAKKIDINKKTKADNKAIEMLLGGAELVGRIILVLIILDYLGIGRSIISALAQGVTFAVAIALGLSFGKALEDDAKKTVNNIKKLFGTQE